MLVIQANKVVDPNRIKMEGQGEERHKGPLTLPKPQQL
jgi:hypothetical protein